MRMMSRLAAASLLSLISSPAFAAHHGDSVQDCWKPAFEAADADAVAACYAEDAVLWLPGAPKMQGREAIRAGYADFFGQFSIKSMTLKEAGSVAGGEHVTAWGSFELVMVSKEDGKEITQVGRYTDVSRKVDGHWVYVMDHASDDPPAAAAAAADESAPAG
jgi:uncharacterized protein (TIGR02246 family)